MPKTFVIVRHQFPALHAWTNCPHEEVSFLRHPHRHMFHVEVKVEVKHEDRDVEFFMLKNCLTQMIHDLYAHRDLGSRSCEMLCHEIRDSLHLNYPEPLYIHSISVFEDNENGAEVIF